MPSVQTYLKRPYLMISFGAALLVLFKVIVFLAFPPGWLSPVELKLEVWMEEDESLSRKDQVFLQIYQDTGKGMNEEQSRRIPVAATGEYESTRIVLPYRKWSTIRLDGPPRTGVFAIRSLRMVADEETLAWEGESLTEVLVPAVQLTEMGSDGRGGLLYRSSGTDPQFSLLVESPEPQVFGAASLKRLAFPLGVSFCGFLLWGWAGVFLVKTWKSMREAGGPLVGARGVYVVIGTVILVVVYSSIGKQAEQRPVPQHMAGHNLYFHLTESFLHGQLHLLEEPLRPLLQLQNPFNPSENEGLRLHDATFFDDRYYVYFGPAPVLTLYLPWKILTGGDLPDRWADAILLSGAFLFLFLIFVRSQSLFQAGAESRGPLVTAFLALGLTTGALFLMARSVVYEVALSSALFWMSAAVFLSLEGLQRGRSRKLLLFAGVALGMAMASRHSFVLASLFLVGAVLIYVCVWERPVVRGLTRFLALSLPAGAIGLLLLAHNQLRFEDPLEFGHNFQIGLVDPQEVDFLDASNLPYNLKINLLQPAEFYPPFPWIHLRGQKLLDWIDSPDSHIRVEKGLGLLFANPYLLLLPFLFPRKLFRGGSDPRGIWLVGVVAGIALINFVIIAMFSYSAPRYAVDYVPWMALLFTILWSLRVNWARRVWHRDPVTLIFVTALTWSILVHLGLALDRII